MSLQRITFSELDKINPPSWVCWAYRASLLILFVHTVSGDVCANNIVKKENLQKIDKEVEDELQKAIDFARKSPLPEPEEALDDVYTI